MTAYNLKNLFGTRIFRIPDYQRGYSWQEKQLDELWDDLEEIHIVEGEYRKHYTGTLYIEKTLPQEMEKWYSGVEFYNVVDGQQRLTTISILLFELINATQIGYAEENRDDLIKTYLYKSNLSGENRIYKFCYALTDNNYSFLLNTIYEDKKVILRQGHLNLYSKNLMLAKQFFREKIAGLEHQQKDNLFRKVTTALQFDIRTIERDLDVQAVFETMNNRGKPLSTLEKLKNRLIYLAEKLSGPPEDLVLLRRKINQAWAEIFNSLAQNPDSILDEDVFLSAHLSLYRKPKESTFSENLAEQKVFEMFCNKPEKYSSDESGKLEEPISYKKIDDYIVKLSELAPIWFKIHNSDNKIIKRILILNSSKEIKIFITAVLYKIKDDIRVNIIFEKLEKILFRNQVPGIGIMDERNPANWARDLYNNEDDANRIIDRQNELLSIPVDIQSIIRSFNALFTYVRGANGFHRWSALKYFLFEYDNYLKLVSRETNDKVLLSEFYETTIEHVIPQSFKENWQSELLSLTEVGNDERIALMQKVIINSLGNLTILKNGKNSSLGNKSWATKKERFRTGSYNEIDISSYELWTINSIIQRGTEMLKFLETKIDGLSFSESDIEKILFYEDFIINTVYNRNQNIIIN
ncbi:MAG: DUF262 domain-containing protein [Crocinitomicaceae bacterium]|nr:DUF262 domain-containing protein [Crocinitomicaceae bacterium]MBK8926681.1 DUF262 domain-containing protein [Crocinitomicaceae bacterium]